MSKGQPSSISGIETIKVLRGASDGSPITVAALAERTGVSRHTVDTVLRRYSTVFEHAGIVKKETRGRPAVLWQLRPGAVSAVTELIDRLRASLS
jgi:predicted ArsR family transcriptional regulator